MHLVPEHEDTPAATPVVTPVVGETRRRRTPVRIAGLAALASLALAGCQGQVSNGYLPPVVSDSGQRVTDLWIGRWVATLAVGVRTWGLMLYAALRYRKPKGDETPPAVERKSCGKDAGWST